MKRFLFHTSALLLLCAPAQPQTVNASQQVLVQGLRANAGQGSFRAASYAADGSLFVLYDQGDGIRILKSDSVGSSISAQTRVGVAGDTGLAMTLDPVGNVYVAGTTSSSSLSGSNGAAFPNRADASTNSFLAKFDANLNLIFLTFLGSGRTAVASLAATADAVFVTGITFSSTFPVTPSGIQQTPALNSTENGFVERFTANGATLVYATYLTGANGNTIPTAIVADPKDNAYITGSTSATGYPTLNALQPAILGSNSGFLSKLTPNGDGFVYSTFLAGDGITSLAFDTSGHSLLLTGNISVGQFPVATAPMPLTSAAYQTLLQIPLDGQSVTSSVLLVPGSQSFVTPGASGDAWVSGSLTTPIFPGVVPPDYNAGDSFLLHLTSNNAVDQTLRFGGVPIKNPSYASITTQVAAPAVRGSSVTLPGTLQTLVSSSLLPSQRFDLPQVQAPNGGLLPNVLRDAIPSAGSCNSQCNGTAAMLSTVSIASSAPSLSFSSDNSPNITLRNLGSATATGLSLTAAGFAMASNCGTSLPASSQCSIALTGGGPGSITASATNAASATTSLGINSLQPDALALSATELDFGIATASSPTTQVIAITNLTALTQTFTSALDLGPNANSGFTEAASDCTKSGGSGTYSIAANSTCHITLTLNVSSSSANDGPVTAYWKIGTRDIVLTGFAQAAALNVSSSRIDFGTHFAVNGIASGINLPRYLYLSNNSNAAVSHATAFLPSNAAFAISDNCPSVLLPHSVCQMKLTYSPAQSPSQDALRLALDDGLTVLLTGTTLPPASVTGSSSNPSLSVSATSLTFTTPVIVTGVSSNTQSLVVKNTGAAAFALSVAVSGDFALTNGCPSLLPGGASCTLIVGFAPTQPGTRLGLLSLVAGTGFSPTYVSLSGAATAILPANNGILDLGQTRVGEPVVLWYKIQQSIPSLIVSSNSAAFNVVLAPDTGTGHGSLPSMDFARTATAACNNCWLGIQLLSQTAGLQAATLSISTTTSGSPYTLTLTGTVLPVQGLLLTPIMQDFGVVNINSSSAPATFTLANLFQSAAATSVQSVSTSGDFAITSNNTGGASCSGTLVATASCFIQVAFSPTAIGQRSGTLTVVTDSGTATSTLTGFGAPDQGLALNPTELDFDNAPGSVATQQSVILSNTGNSILKIGTPASSDPSFAINSGCTTLAPGALCSVSVRFTPQVATEAALLTIPVTSTINGQVVTTSYTVTLRGRYTTSGSGLQILPAEVNFGSTATGASGTTRQFIVNNLTTKPLDLTLQLPRQFPLTSSTSCTTLPVGGSCTFSTEFLPVTNGPATGTVYVQGVSTDGLTTSEALTYMLGYGAGTGVLEVDGLPIPYSPVNFGQVGSGQSVSHTLSLSNSGTNPLTIHRISSDPPFLSTNNCGSALASGASCNVTITYAPVYQSAGLSAARSDTDTLVVESDAASSPDVVSLSGLATPVVVASPSNPVAQYVYSLTQSALTFGNTRVGSSSAPQVVTLTNTGTMALHMSTILPPTDFLASTTCTTLPPGSSCTITVRFAPASTSASVTRSGALHILSDASTSLEFISLLGISSPSPLTFSSTSLNFGSVSIGANTTLSLRVTNTTPAAVTFLGYAAGGDYSVSNGSCPAVGSTLPGGSSCSLNVTFTPSAAGARVATLSLTTDATTLPLTVSLTGTGVQAVAPTPTFVLTANGGTTATLTVASGSPAVYSLALTPMNGFTGPVALTCTPVVPATYASCSLLSSSLVLSGSALTSTATINTITTVAMWKGAGIIALALPPVLFWRRRRRGIGLAAIAFVVAGCGSSSHPPVSSNVQRTPAGTYQYQVTASSTSGTVVSSTVTLNLIVQ